MKFFFKFCNFIIAVFQYNEFSPVSFSSPKNIYDRFLKVVCQTSFGLAIEGDKGTKTVSNADFLILLANIKIQYKSSLIARY